MNQGKKPLYAGRLGRGLSLSLGVGALLAWSAFVPVGSAQTVQGNTPRFVDSAVIVNHEEATKEIEVSLWLNPHNKAALDQLAKDVYDPKSASYRHFLKNDELQKRFAPSAAEAAMVAKYLQQHNLQVVSTEENNWFVRARGTVSAVESAFHVQLNNYIVNGEIVRANVHDPFVDPAVAPLVSHISGMTSAAFTHPNQTRAAPSLGTTKGPQASGFTADNTASSDFFVSNCFPGTKTETMDTAGGYPKAKYFGNDYYASYTGPGCGYTPTEIQAAYHLTDLYKEGLDGTGQTIVIIDWCGSPTILADANAFSARFGLPKLTSANFTTLEYPAKSYCSAPDVEINIDVEWAHAIAPGASIFLLVPPSASFQDIDAAEFYAINRGFGNVISGSYGAPEAFVSPTELATQDLINEIGAIQGVSADFSSGDYGDFVAATGVQTVSAPASSAYATAVGGIALALNTDNSIKWQTGWGNNQTLLDDTGSVASPPEIFGFVGGAGGGPSGFFAKPPWQAALPGPARQLPDISWLADPYTGGVIAITTPNQYPPISYQVWGGTSLACPMFSALWAIANQAAGKNAPLGLATVSLYSMSQWTITDIKPKNSWSNVSGTVWDSATKSTKYSDTDLIGQPEPFYSAFWDYPGSAYTTIDLSFGTDSSLTITPGWDNVTGLGVPVAKSFVNSFKPQ